MEILIPEMLEMIAFTKIILNREATKLRNHPQMHLAYEGISQQTEFLEIHGTHCSLHTCTMTFRGKR